MMLSVHDPVHGPHVILVYAHVPHYPQVAGHDRGERN